MRLIGPVFGTPLSSSGPLASLPKSTSACSVEMSPEASAAPCWASRHQAGFVDVAATLRTSGKGSLRRKATLKNAGGAAAVPAPPGWVASAAGWGAR